MNRKTKFLAFFCATLSALMLLGIVLGASSIGPWPVTGTLPQSQQGYAMGSGSLGCGRIAFSTTTAYYLSSGTTVATSVPCNYLNLQLSGTGILSTGGTNGIAFCTSGGSSNGGTAAGAIAMGASGGTANNTPVVNLVVPVANLNQLTLTGTGQASYIYGN